MSSFPDFSNYGYQIIRELGHNRAGGRVTYPANEMSTQRSVVVKQFQFARTGATWSDYEAYERSRCDRSWYSRVSPRLRQSDS